PFLIRTLGRESYGLWVLVMSFSVLLGFLSLLDLGIQSSVVRFVAEHNASENKQQLIDVFRTALAVYLVIGAAAGVGIALFARLGLLSIFQVSPSLAPAGQQMLYLMALQ